MKKATDIASLLKRRIYFSLGDKGYDHNKNYNFCNKKNICLVTPVRRFKKKTISKIKHWAKKFEDSLKGKSFYQRRADNERFFAQIKDVFLIDPLPLIRIKNVSSYVSIVCLFYLLRILYNCLNGRSLRAIKSTVA